MPVPNPRCCTPAWGHTMWILQGHHLSSHQQSDGCPISILSRHPNWPYPPRTPCAAPDMFTNTHTRTHTHTHTHTHARTHTRMHAGDRTLSVCSMRFFMVRQLRPTTALTCWPGRSPLAARSAYVDLLHSTSHRPMFSLPRHLRARWEAALPRMRASPSHNLACTWPQAQAARHPAPAHCQVAGRARGVAQCTAQGCVLTARPACAHQGSSGARTPRPAVGSAARGVRAI